jgi:LPXTG-motif cell wall-anchored protein
MRKLIMLAAMLAVAVLAASPALAQDEPAVVADAKANEAKAGGATAEAECKDGYIVSKAGGVVAKAPCEPEPPKAAPAPPPKAAPPPPPAPAPAPAPAPKQLPASGGSGVASLFALGAGVLLVGGGLLARRIVR